jgi:uncharacterized peroxidase-related enzyme
MSFIQTISEQQAEEPVQRLYGKLKGNLNYLPNYARVYCYRPAVMEDWSTLQKTLQSTITHRRYELVVLAAARAINNSYCSLAHAKILMRKYYSENELLAIINDHAQSPLSEADHEMMRFASQVAADSSKTSQQDIDRLKALGFSDAEIFDITACAAARCFFAKISDALGVLPDHDFLQMKPALRRLLVSGRPIDRSGE